MKTIKKSILCYVIIVLAIYVFTSSDGHLYSQQKIVGTFDSHKTPDYLKVPKFATNVPVIDKFTSHRYVGFYEIIMPTKPIPANQQHDNAMLGYYYHKYAFDRNSVVDYKKSYLGFYSVIRDKDIFPYSGALYCRVKSDSRTNYDAFLVEKKYYPEKVTIGTDTLIIPYIPPKNECNRSYLFGYFSADIIEKDVKGELQVKITYIPKMDCQEPLENKVSAWYHKGDIVQFFKATNRDNPTMKPHTGTHGSSLNLGHWPESLNCESFGLRIVNIVPRDPYPMRVVGDNVKGRLIGWIELDKKIIPLDPNGKPLEQNIKK